jgi:uncharacterized membrane protein (UPF0127 family)
MANLGEGSAANEGAPNPARGVYAGMQPPRRFRGLRHITLHGHTVPVAGSRTARALGLVLLERERAGAGLLIPRCRSVHTFGMRFALDVAFLDSDGSVLRQALGVPPRRVLTDRQASAVLESPSEGGR